VYVRGCCVLVYPVCVLVLDGLVDSHCCARGSAVRCVLAKTAYEAVGLTMIPRTTVVGGFKGGTSL
jgi:hypothetical protein